MIHHIVGALKDLCFDMTSDIIVAGDGIFLSELEYTEYLGSLELRFEAPMEKLPIPPAAMTHDEWEFWRPQVCVWVEPTGVDIMPRSQAIEVKPGDDAYTMIRDELMRFRTSIRETREEAHKMLEKYPVTQEEVSDV